MKSTNLSTYQTQGDGVDFELEVASFFELMGYDIEHRVNFPGEEIDFIAKRYEKGVESIIMVECKDQKKPIGRTHIANFFNLAETHLKREFTHAYFISRSGFIKSSYKEELFKKNKFIKFLSFEEFISQLIDFRFYLRRVVRDFEIYDKFFDSEGYQIYQPLIDQYLRDDLYNKYIRLRGNLLSPEISKNINDMTQYIINSINSSNSKIILVGEIGSGKTSICLYINYYLANYNISSNYTVSSKIPIFIPLSKAMKSDNIFELIHNRLSDYGLNVGGVSLLRRVVPHLPIVYFLDGFDEMCESNSTLSMDEMAGRLEPLFTLASPVILTSRSHYFTESSQIRSLFAKLLKDPNKLDILEICPLTEKLVITQLKKLRPNTWKSDWQIIQDLFNLEDLSKRPILFKMIIDSLDQLYFEKTSTPDGQIAVGPTELYRTYTNKWLSSKLSRGVINTDIRHKFVLGLAELMWLRGEDSLELNTLRDHIDAFKNRNEINDKDFLRIPYDALNCSFLIRTSEDKFSFSHKSFMEYFIAEIISEEIRRKQFNISTKKRIDRAVSLYLRELIKPADSDNLFVLMKHDKPEGRINAHHIFRQLLRLNRVKPTNIIISEIRKLLDTEDIPVAGAEIAVTLGYMGDLTSQDNYLKRLYQDQKEELDKIIKTNIIDYYEATGAVTSSFRQRIENPHYEYARIWYLLSLGLIGVKKDIEYLKTIRLVNCREFEKEVIDDSIKRINNRVAKK